MPRAERKRKKTQKKVSDTEPGAAEQRVEYDAAATEAKKEKKEARKNLWGLFEQLLDNPLVADWQTIVKAETVEPGYIARDGKKKPAYAAGRSQPSRRAYVPGRCA